MADINKETAVKIKYSFINHLDGLKLYQKVFNLQIQQLNFVFTTNNKMNSCKKIIKMEIFYFFKIKPMIATCNFAGRIFNNRKRGFRFML